MILTIQVKPNSKTDQIFYDQYGNLKVKIRAQPIDGKANSYLERYLSEIFEVPKSYITILKGLNTEHKKVEISASEEHITKILHTFEVDK